MKIVIEYVLLENFFINLIVLKTVELFLKEKGKFFWVSACLGSALTLATPLLGLSTFGNFLLQFGFAIFYVCISFKFSTFKKFLSLFVCYFVSSFLYGGACYFFEGLFGITSLIVVLFVVTIVFLFVKFLLRKRQRKKDLESFCFDVQIETGGKNHSFKAFLDSGNFLFDPITEKPVCLINFKAFSKLFEEIGVEDIIRKNDKIKSLKFAHYISFNTLNNADKILVFQVDTMKIGERVFEKPIFGLSLKNFNQTFGTDVILNNEFAN